MAITRAQQYRQMLREGSVAMQGGIRNYLGKQKTVSDVPLKWKSGPGHPETELAYITKAEKNLLIKKDLHKSLKDGPNKGPGGIMSLNNDGIGDLGGPGNVGPGNDATDTGDLGSEKANDASLSAGNKSVGFGGKDGDPRTTTNLERALGFAKNVFDKTLIGRAINTLGKFGPKSKDTVEMYGPKGKQDGPMAPGRDITEDDDDDGKGDGGQGIIPIFGSAPTTTSEAEEESTDVVTSAPRIAYRLMNEGGMADDSMPYEGGIMDLESARQMYGLGKLVRKVTRSVKKIAKSPIGKAALLYAGTGALGNLAGGSGLGGMFKGFTSPTSFLGGAKNIFTKAGLKNIAFGKAPTLYDVPGTSRMFTADAGTSGLFGMGGKLTAAGAGRGIAALSALPLLGVGVEEDEEQEEFSPYLGQGLDIADIRSRPRFYQGQAYRLMSSGGSPEDAKKEEDLSNDPNYKGWVKVYEASPEAAEMNEKHSEYLQFYNRKAEGGSMKEPVAKKVMPLLDMDGQEMDFRAEGGFVPIGRMEKADDVPARLSKNEFVFTADAVRNAGEGDIDKGAEVMYNMMKNLESGGEVSEESQGLEGARKMFQTSQRLEEVL